MPLEYAAAFRPMHAEVPAALSNRAADAHAAAGKACLGRAVEPVSEEDLTAPSELHRTNVFAPNSPAAADSHACPWRTQDAAAPPKRVTGNITSIQRRGCFLVR